ncbi:MAG: hypothetical protein J5771_02110 [Bacteroidales bacterium]|nr:hypothetical protein [Bacteroidales bacterium]
MALKAPKADPSVRRALLPLEEMAELSPLFRGSLGTGFAKVLKWMFSIDKVEAFYENICGWDGSAEKGAVGVEFCRRAIEESGYRMTLNGMPRDEAVDWLRENLPAGPFITVSNHTLGALDGLGLIDLFGSAMGTMQGESAAEPRYKFMVNALLMRMRAAASCFISVTPTGAVRTAPTAESINGVYAAMEHLRRGGCLGLFPAGAVSNLELGRRPVVEMPDRVGPDDGVIAGLPAVTPGRDRQTLREPRVRDREWQMSIVKFIKRAGVPVLPVYNAALNSSFFYSLGLIDWRLRLTRLPAELLNKSGRELRFVAGPLITPDQIAAAGSLAELRTLLRSAVYSLQ